MKKTNRGKTKDIRRWQLIIYPSSGTSWARFFGAGAGSVAVMTAERIATGGCEVTKGNVTTWYPAASILRVVLQRESDVGEK